MTIMEISIAAGDILLALERHAGTVRLGELPCARACSHAALLMALGWLFKEGWVSVHPAAGDWVVKRQSGRLAVQ